MISIPSSSPIFLVDDQEVDLMIISQVLKRTKLNNPVETFDSGDAVLSRLEACRDNATPAQIPGLILLDINMPGMNGFEVLTWIRSQKEFEAIPVVSMLTSSDAVADMSRARELGASAFLTKPSGIEEFVAMFDLQFAND